MSPSEPQTSRSAPGNGLALASPPRGAKIRVAYQDYRGRFYFLRPEIDANQMMGVAMDRVRAAMGANMTKMILGFSLFGSAFCEPVVETATISAVRLNGIEACHFPREVFLSDREVSPELTALFNRYAVAIGTTASFAAKYPDMITGSMMASNANINKAITVSYRLKQGIVLWLVVFGLIVSVLISLIFGLKMRNIQVAFAAFVAMTLVMTVPLNVIFWMTGRQT